MKISTRGRYGLQALIDLAAHEDDKCVTLGSVAERQGIPLNYLMRLIAPLREAGLVKSVRGASGGYILNKPPKEISVGFILRILEGPLYPVDCLGGDTAEKGACGSAGCDNCVTRPVWEKLYASVNSTLESFSLGDLVTDYLNTHRSD